MDNVNHCELLCDFKATHAAVRADQDYLFNLRCSENARVIDYFKTACSGGGSSRTTFRQFVNLDSDGGFFGTVPWVGCGPRIRDRRIQFAVAVWGNSYAIGGDGATAIREGITQWLFRIFTALSDCR